jgi:hypothetical protein
MEIITGSGRVPDWRVMLAAQEVVGRASRGIARPRTPARIKMMPTICKLSQPGELAVTANTKTAPTVIRTVPEVTLITRPARARVAGGVRTNSLAISVPGVRRDWERPVRECS